MQEDPGEKKPRTREEEAAREDAKTVSSQILNVIDLNGKVTEPGPGIATCGPENSDTRFKVKHPWSVYDVPEEDMEAAMERLKKDLPERGWKIVSYGPNRSPARSLQLIADYKHGHKQFSVNITFLDKRDKDGDSGHKSLINVNLVSACFEVPEGQKVKGF